MDISLYVSPQALEKKARAEKVLEELNNACDPEPSDVDKEGITQEERYMLRKIGLRMKPFLLLGMYTWNRVTRVISFPFLLNIVVTNSHFEEQAEGVCLMGL